MSARVLVVEFKQVDPSKFQLGVEMPCTMKQFFLDDLFLGDFITNSTCFGDIGQTIVPDWTLVAQEYGEYTGVLFSDESDEDHVETFDGEWGELDADTAMDVLDTLHELEQASEAGAFYQVFISC
jgi:hypothetical protein